MQFAVLANCLISNQTKNTGANNMQVMETQSAEKLWLQNT